MNALYVGDRGQRDEQADAGRDERLGDARHHGLRALQRAAGEIVERADDAEHGAEQADERRVVAERAEEREPLLVAQALVLDDRGACAPRRRRRRRAACVEAGARDRGLHRARARRALASAAAGALVAQRRERRGERARAAALLDEEPDAARPSPRSRRATSAEQQPQHPARAGAQHEVEDLGVDRVVSLFMTSPDQNRPRKPTVGST